MSGHNLRKVTIVYHRDEGIWWADSPDMPGFSAVGDDFATTRNLAREDVPFFFDDSVPTDISEKMENGASVMPDSVLFFLKADSALERNETNNSICSLSVPREKGIKNLQVA